MSTRVVPAQRRMCQFTLLNRAAFNARHASIRRYARRQQRYVIRQALRDSRGMRDYAHIGSTILHSYRSECAAWLGRLLQGRSTPKR